MSAPASLAFAQKSIEELKRLSIAELQSELGLAHNEIKTIYDKQDLDADKETGKSRPATSEEMDALRKFDAYAREIEDVLIDHKDADEIRSAINRRKHYLSRPSADMPAQPGEENAVKTLAAKWLESEDVKAWRDNWIKTGGPSGGNCKSPRALLDGIGLKQLFTGLSSTSGGALVVNDRKPIVDMGGFFAPLALLDLATIAGTESDLVEFVRVTANTNNASEVEEATSSGDSSGAVDESGATLSVVQINVQEIAHMYPVTRRAIADARQLQGIVNELGTEGLKARFETQLLNGSGTAPYLQGVYNTSGILTQAYVDSRVDSLRRARTKVSLSANSGGGGVTPTAYVMHPNDWQVIELLRDNNDRYLGGGPFSVTPPMLWGLPVVLSEYAIEGLPIVADWRKLLVWDREQISLEISDSHADWFSRGILALRFAMRAASGLQRTAAFCQVDLTA